MPRAPSPKIEDAKKLFDKGLKLIDIANKLEIPEGTVRRWKSTYKWGSDRSDKKTSARNKRGAPKGSKNALGNKGGAAPIGNLNTVKHGAYQNIYLEYLPDEEKDLYEKMGAAINMESEIKLLRLKIARLLDRKRTFFYDMFGKKVEKEISEEDREQGIIICMNQLERLVKTQAAIIGDTEKLQLEREKFDFSKYKSEIELKIKKEKHSKEMGDNNNEELSKLDKVLEEIKGVI